jgi:uncharacterized membrane protein
MKQKSYVRPLIFGLSLAVISAGALASGKQHDAGEGCQKSDDNKQQHMQNQSKGMMQLPAELIASLKLSETQANALSSAQTAANGMRASMMQGMREARQGSKAQMGDGNFDPRVMFEQQEQRMVARQKARQAIQAQWLTFWDSLDTEQKSTLQDYLKNHAQKGNGHHQRS